MEIHICTAICINTFEGNCDVTIGLGRTKDEAISKCDANLRFDHGNTNVEIFRNDQTFVVNGDLHLYRLTIQSL